MTKKYVLFGVLSLAVFIVIFIALFAKDEEKAETVKANLPKIKVGMMANEVKQLLSAPDTTYALDSASKYGAGVTVLHYYQGLAATDVVRVLIRKDTVVEVVTQN